MFVFIKSLVYSKLECNPNTIFRCCEFEILCDKAYVGPIRKLSPAAAKIGFGAGLEAFDMGIIASSQAYSTICVNHHEREKGYVSDESKAESTTLKFQLVEGACDKFDYRATLTACHSMENAHSQKGIITNLFSMCRFALLDQSYKAKLQTLNKTLIALQNFIQYAIT